MLIISRASPFCDVVFRYARLIDSVDSPKPVRRGGHLKAMLGTSVPDYARAKKGSKRRDRNISPKVGDEPPFHVCADLDGVVSHTVPDPQQAPTTPQHFDPGPPSDVGAKRSGAKAYGHWACLRKPKASSSLLMQFDLLHDRHGVSPMSCDRQARGERRIRLAT